MPQNTKSSNDDIQDSHLSTLLAEYQNVAQIFEKSQENLIQLLGIGVASSVGAIGFLTSQPSPLPSGIAWLLPLAFFFFYGLIVYILHLRLGNFWNARILETRINLMLPEITIIRSVPEFPSARYFSSSRGNKKVLFLFNMLVGMAGILLLGILYICFFAIYSVNHTSGTAFFIIYSVIGVLEIIVMVSLNRELPIGFRILMKQIVSLGRMPTEKEYSQLYKNTYSQINSTLFINLLPRPWDVTAKGMYFWSGLFIGYIFYGVSTNILKPITLLFETSNPSQISIWEVIGFGTIFFILEELLLQQAKLLWDDIRDTNRDKELPLNKGRALASGLLNKHQATINIGLRLLIAFTLGGFLGGQSMILIFTFILFHQALYILWAKPKAESHPILLLFVLSFNISLRFMAGFVLISGFTKVDFLIILLISVMFFQSMSNSALLWRIEVEYLQKKKGKAFLRPQSLFFLQNGHRVQHFAIIATLLILSVLYFSLTKHQINTLFSSLTSYGHTSIIIFLAIFGIILLPSLLSALIERITHSGGRLLNNLLGKLEKFTKTQIRHSLFANRILAFVKAATSIGGILIMIIGGILFVLGLYMVNTFMVFFGFALYNIGLMFVYENMDFLDYTMARIKEQIDVFSILLPIYLFSANSQITLFMLFKVLVDYDFSKALKSKLEKHQNELTNIHTG